MNKYYLKIIFIFSILSFSNLCWATLSATADRTELGADETLQLTVSYNKKVAGEPDFSPLVRDFEILSNNRQQQSSWINGTSTSSTNWKILLLPKRQGQLKIPALSFKGKTSNSIAILVRPADPSAKSAGNQAVFIETSIDKNSVYIQEQIILTHRLYYSVQLQSINISEFEIPDALIQQVSENQFTQRIKGKNYSVIEVKFSLFPQAAGKLNIPAQRISALEGSGFGFFSRGKRIMRRTEAKTVDVMVRPAHIAPNQWTPSSKLSLKETWSSPATTLTAGEPITRTISISAQGLTAAQIQPLPTIEKPKTEDKGFKIYPDQPKLEDKKSVQGILGTRTESIAMVPNQEGELILPAIEVEWWDTVNNRMQTSRLPARSFTVIAGDTAPQNNSDSVTANKITTALNAPSVQSEIQQSSLLTRWSLTLNALLIAALVGLLYLRRTPPHPRTASPSTAVSSSKQQLRLIEKQAAEKKFGAMRDSILQWGAEVFPKQPPRSLKQLATIMENHDLQQQFAILDQCLFKAETEDKSAVDISVIVKQLKAYSPVRNAGKDRGVKLKPLYPDS